MTWPSATKMAILGLGRSGVAVAKGALANGWVPTVYDQKPLDHESVAAAASELESLGVGCVGNWNSAFSKESADILITSPGVDKRNALLLQAAANGIPVIGEIEFAFQISKAPIVAITGTNGKSTTTVMTWLCVREAGIDATLCGNIYGSGYDEVPLTEAALNSTASQVLVAEISSFQLEWIRDFRPVVAGITNITQDHLTRYTSFYDYAETKREIFRNMGERDIAVAKMGDPFVLPPSRIQSWTFGEPTSDAWSDANTLHFGDVVVERSRLQFEETHNVTNALMAGLLSLAVVDRVWTTQDRGTQESSLNGLARFKGLEHRMERLGERDGVLVINNSMCTNPAAVVASTSSLPRRQHVIVGGRNKDMDFAPLGEFLAQTEHEIYLYGADSAQILRSLSRPYPVFTTMEQAFTAAAAAARPGEAIVLSPGCASQDQFADFRDRGSQFRHIAKEWLTNEMDSNRRR